MTSASCPECSATFDVELDSGEVACPECGAIVSVGVAQAAVDGIEKVTDELFDDILQDVETPKVADGAVAAGEDDLIDDLLDDVDEPADMDIESQSAVAGTATVSDLESMKTISIDDDQEDVEVDVQQMKSSAVESHDLGIDLDDLESNQTVESESLDAGDVVASAPVAAAADLDDMAMQFLDDEGGEPTPVAGTEASIQSEPLQEPETMDQAMQIEVDSVGAKQIPIDGLESMEPLQELEPVVDSGSEALDLGSPADLAGATSETVDNYADASIDVNEPNDELQDVEFSDDEEFEDEEIVDFVEDDPTNEFDEEDLDENAIDLDVDMESPHDASMIQSDSAEEIIEEVVSSNGSRSKILAGALVGLLGVGAAGYFLLPGLMGGGDSKKLVQQSLPTDFNSVGPTSTATATPEQTSVESNPPAEPTVVTVDEPKAVPVEALPAPDVTASEPVPNVTPALADAPENPAAASVDVPPKDGLTMPAPDKLQNNVDEVGDGQVALEETPAEKVSSAKVAVPDQEEIAMPEIPLSTEKPAVDSEKLSALLADATTKFEAVDKQDPKKTLGALRDFYIAMSAIGEVSAEKLTPPQEKEVRGLVESIVGQRSMWLVLGKIAPSWEKSAKRTNNGFVVFGSITDTPSPHQNVGYSSVPVRWMNKDKPLTIIGATDQIQQFLGKQALIIGALDPVSPPDKASVRLGIVRPIN